MDDQLISLILHGIKLAKEVEAMLQSLGRQPQQEMVSKFDEIIRVFITAREKLNSIQDPQMVYRELQQQQQQLNPKLQEYYAKSMMELFMAPDMKPSSSDMDVQAQAQPQPQPIAASSSSQRPRIRKDDPEKWTMRVAAPRMGNTEIPPEDGYTWRKYGQKEILGSKFPRGYYRCTHQKLYQCPAKKQVQRLDGDPFTFEVTYRGEHTCHMSATAPSTAPPFPPPPPPNVTQGMIHMAAPHHHPPLPWLEFNLGGSGGGGAGPSSSAGGGGSRFNKEDQYLVADLADVMFNSGSSSSNSMELIFTSASMEDKWDTGDNKKI